MTLKDFTRHLNRLIELKKAQDDVERVMYGSSLKDGFSGCLYGCNPYQDLVVNILQSAMEDKNDWIGYWLYDLEYGNKYKPGMIKDKNKKNIKLKTVNDLYNLLIKSSL